MQAGLCERFPNIFALVLHIQPDAESSLICLTLGLPIPRVFVSWKRPALTSHSLDSLRTVTLDPVGKRPALILQLGVLLEIHTVLGHDGNRVRVQGSGISVEQHLHTLLDDVDGLLLGELGGALLVGGVLSHDGLGQHLTVAGGQAGTREGGAEQVGGGQEGLALLVEAGDQQVVPEGVELGAAVVQQLGQVLVQVPGVQGMRGVRVVVLVDGELCEVAVEVLHVRHVAAEADDRRRGKGAQALDVVEAGERSVRGCSVRRVRVSQMFRESGEQGRMA